MPSLKPNSPLLDALAQLEACLETPVVPGELEVWTGAVHSATEEVARRLTDTVQNEHPPKLKQLAHDDPGLFRRVAELKEDDEESLRRLASFRAQLETLSRKAVAAEPDELQVADSLQAFIAHGLALVIQARKQEVALETWMGEALDRDRGVVD